MAVKPHPTNPDTWIIDCRPDGYKGKRVRIEFEGTEKQALNWEKSMMRRHTSSGVIKAPKRIGVLWPQYIRYCRIEIGEAKVKDASSCWEHHLKEHFAKLQPKMLTKEVVEAYKEKRIKEYRWGKKEYGTISKRTVTKELMHLSSFMTWAVDHGHCDKLPFSIKGFSAKQTKAKKKQPLIPDQISLLLEVIECEYYLPTLLMTDAGLRVTEALTLTSEQVDLNAGIMFVTGKGSKERIVPITTDRLMAALKKKNDTTGYLTINEQTGKPYTSMKKALERAAKYAGLEKHIHHHLLRHSFGTLAVLAGADLSSVQNMMGHESIQTTQIYLNMAAEQIKEQGRKLNQLVCPHGQNMDNDKPLK